ncbi:MAG: GNAT family N-acetyltransferase [Bacteroidota bacterium]
MITVSTDKDKLNLPFIQNFLKDTYWAKNRTIETLQTSIDNSLCFGIYLNNEQIGFARVITDLVSIAYPMDVFVIEEHQGKGYATILLNAVMSEPQLQQIKIWGLATLDAHSFYKKFGFTSVDNPEKLMEKIII